MDWVKSHSNMVFGFIVILVISLLYIVLQHRGKDKTDKNIKDNYVSSNKPDKIDDIISEINK